VDADGDGFGGRENVNGFPAAFACGDGSSAGRPAPFVFVGGCRGADVELPYVANTSGQEDCCDRYFLCDSSGASPLSLTPDNAFPGRAQGSDGFVTCGSAPGAGLGRDFNCDGRAELDPSTVLPPLSCELGTELDCTTHGGRVGDPDCSANGVLTYTSRACIFSGGLCVPNGAGQQTALCL
jgi:hypothetical protein